jgi:hypothetical protein
MPALADQRFQRRTFVIAQANDVLLDRDIRHIPIPRTFDDAPESQRTYSESTTGGTSVLSLK